MSANETSGIKMTVAVVDQQEILDAIRELDSSARRNTWAIAIMLLGLLVTILTGCGEPQVIASPKRYMSLKLAHRQPIEFWRTVDGIYGMQETSQTITRRSQLTDEENARLRVYSTLMPTVTFNHDLLGWEESLADDNPTFAAFVMVRKNLDAGCDWYLYHPSGERAGKWNETLKALDLSDHCPKGVYGSSVGLTARQWILGPYLDMIRGSRFTTAFDGVILEDGPEKGLWHYEWDWIRLGGVDVNRAAYIAAMDSCYVEYLQGFVAGMRKDLVVLINGHQTPGGPGENPQTWEVFSGCKIERMGKWGGWPEGNIQEWWTVYNAVEQLYWYGREPRPGKKRDRLHGWDVSIAQIEIDTTMTIAEAHRWQRLMVGMVLMGDASYSISWYHDHHGGEPSAEWLAPELAIDLGYPTGPWEGKADSLIWREFEVREEPRPGHWIKARKRVTLNLTDRPQFGIGPKDAAWTVVSVEQD
jgi:hypothetical protein